MLNKLTDLPSGIVHLIYAVIALPTLFYLADKVTIIAEDAAARRETQKAQEKRINELEHQVDYLMKRLIDKKASYIENSSTEPPTIWLQTMPVMIKQERLKI